MARPVPYQLIMEILTATRADVPTILGFIAELAAYEELTHELETDPAQLEEHLFGPAPVCMALIARRAGEAVGYALFFPIYSTFKTRACLHLEDLYVTPNARGAGFGEAMLRRVAQIADERGCARLQWNVLDWNEAAIGFYQRLGAEVLPDWRTCRVEGAAIVDLARSN